MSEPSILVVEDDETIREALCWALEDEGYKVFEAAHGAIALEMLYTIHPNLIMLDLRMPVMDGWEFSALYHAQVTDHVPIIVLSAVKDRDMSHTALQVQADAFIAKPFDLNVVLDTVSRCLSA